MTAETPVSPLGMPVFVLASRLIPDQDGGFARAVLMRAHDLAAFGVAVTLLTVDPGTVADHALHRAEFLARGAVQESVGWRNLFDDALADPGWLLAAAHPGEAEAGIDYRPIVGADGATVLALPVITGDPDWHLSTAAVLVYDRSGALAGVLNGFGELYRAWLDHVTARSAAVVIVEARTIGELLVPWDAPATLVHTVHTSHLGEPYTPGAPILPLWQRWLDGAARYDAALWPSSAQRDDVVARFGSGRRDEVLPHGTAVVADPLPLSARDRRRAVMVNRLAPGKRLDHAVRIWRRVVDLFPDARLDIFGDGGERARVQAFIDELGLHDAVVLHGTIADPDAVLDTPAVLLSTTAFEGQGLSLLEALGHGTPVISYDVRYGPAESLADGGGMLVPSGDEEAFTGAVLAVLSNDDLWQRLSEQAHAAALLRSRERTAARLLALLQSLTDLP